MPKKTAISKTQPDWLKKIVKDQLLGERRAIRGRIELIKAKLVLEDTIEQINEKFKTEFASTDIFSVTADEEEEVMDLMDDE